VTLADARRRLEREDTRRGGIRVGVGERFVEGVEQARLGVARARAGGEMLPQRAAQAPSRRRAPSGARSNPLIE